MKIQANRKRWRPHMPDLAWLLSGSLLTLLAFLCSLFATLLDEWFHVYCLQDVSVGATLSYRFGLWSFCGDDLAWLQNDTIVTSQTGDSVWSCLSIDTVVPTHPTWLQGTRWFELSGCVACGATFVMMIPHFFMPSEAARGASTGFTVANLTAAIFFTGSLLTVFAVQNRATSLVPPGVCNLTSLPSSYAITLTAVAIGACVLSAGISGIVSEGVMGQPTRSGHRLVREIDAD